MNTEQFYADCAAHFLKHYKPGDHACAVFEQYAKDEFNWTESKAKDFAAQVENGDAVPGMNEDEEQKRFYLWYYINYVINKTPHSKSNKTSEQQPGQQTNHQP